MWGQSSIRNLPPVRLENAWAAIVSHDTFKQVQALLRERAFITIHPKRVASNYLLSGLAKCGYCGKTLIGQDAKGGRFHSYVCGTLQKKGAGSCSAGYTQKDKLEQAVIRKIKEHILTYENLKELVHLVNEEMDASAGDYSERLSVTSVELESVNHRLERLYDALETGSFKLADLAPRIQRLRQRQEQLNAVRLELENLLSDRKVELADMETVKSYVEDLRNLLEDSPLIERKSFIKSFVKEIRVAGNEVVLKYNIPPSVGAPHQETLVVPPIVHYGGR